MVHIYNRILLSHKKDELIPFAAIWIESIILTEVRKTNTILYHLYVNNKIWQKWTYIWNSNIFSDRENKLMATKGEREWGRDKLGVWDEQLLHRK